MQVCKYAHICNYASMQVCIDLRGIDLTLLFGWVGVLHILALRDFFKKCDYPNFFSMFLSDGIKGQSKRNIGLTRSYMDETVACVEYKTAVFYQIKKFMTTGYCCCLNWFKKLRNLEGRIINDSWGEKARK